MPRTMVIFGASGDLTSRKLIPALYLQFQRGKLPDTRIVGVSRSEFSDEEWRKQLAESTKKFVGESFDTQSWQEFAQKIHYCPGDINAQDDFAKLAKRLEEVEANQVTDRVYYVATMPQLYETAAARLGQAGLADDSGGGARRIVIEKPFGTNLESARALNHAIARVFREDQVYRIDHYLGKETVQNMMVFRFGNSIFEPIWNRNYVDHVQITVAEEVQIGRRADYYDRSGILRDMFQNHIFQLMMITAMEGPVKFNAGSVRDEKVKVLRAIRPLRGGDFASCGVRGQYEGYRQEDGVATDSQTETFAALKLNIDNWRWKDVPFYLRSGKALSCRTTQIVINFREPPHLLFDNGRESTPQANRLVIQIQPAEGIQVHFQSKVPDQGMKLRQSGLDFRFDTGHDKSQTDAYQRLLQDALHGDASLFARSDEVELAWEIIDPILAAWRSPAAPPMHTYPIDGWGPRESSEWMEADGRSWFDVCPVIH